MTNENIKPYRVAIYYAPPPESIWWHSGSEWLGRCALSGQLKPQPRIDGIDPELFERLTAAPRQYGWHATLKAPFRLASGQTLATLCAAVRSLCRGHRPFQLAPLEVSRLGQFLALRPSTPQAELVRLADDCVRHLHAWAAPLTEDELARRRNASLTPTQDVLLQAWGYPYVFDQYRFHISLTDILQGHSAEVQEAVWQAAVHRFHPLPACWIDRVSIFVEPSPGEPFRLIEQIGFQP